MSVGVFQFTEELWSRCVDLKTGAVVATFPSITQASKATGAHRSRIRRVIQKEQKSCGGFFWREVGSGRCLAPSDARGNVTTAVEQICLESGKVLDTFNSVAKAKRSQRSSGNAAGDIESLLSGKKRSAGGFLWRHVGSTALPLPKRKHWRARPIEKICVESGEDLETFESLKSAANSVGASASSMCDVFSGSSRTCRGFCRFFWRRKGSKVLPSTVLKH